eukprot:TRINITY_DN43412_c0_g1_i1.p1 TRINITY_DN43412_c0_g1~~TRINITY_DN43412_c0_g1_i1.p1  ORF type:complete len:241 (+),score=47.34 TRINITY_DN43412_c0_g1_i1:56-778(+)
MPKKQSKAQKGPKAAAGKGKPKNPHKKKPAGKKAKGGKAAAHTGPLVSCLRSAHSSTRKKKVKLQWADRKGRRLKTVHAYNAPWAADKDNWWGARRSILFERDFNLRLQPGKSSEFTVNKTLLRAIHFTQAQALGAQTGDKPPTYACLKVTEFSPPDGYDVMNPTLSAAERAQVLSKRGQTQLVPNPPDVEKTIVAAVLPIGELMPLSLSFPPGRYAFHNTSDTTVVLRGSAQGIYIHRL